MTSIYALIDPESKFCRYVGKTKCSLRSRLGKHIYGATRQKKAPKYEWIRKLSENGKIPEIIELESVSNDWQEAEMFWIAYLRSLGADLLNMSDGGEGPNGYQHTEEAKSKISRASIASLAKPEVRSRISEGLKRAFSDPEARAKLSEAHKKSHSRPEVIAKISAKAKISSNRPEYKEKMSKLNKGRKRSAEAIAKSAAGNTGKKRSEDTKARMRAAAQCPLKKAILSEKSKAWHASMSQEEKDRRRHAHSLKMKEIFAKRRRQADEH